MMPSICKVPPTDTFKEDDPLRGLCMGTFDAVLRQDVLGDSCWAFEEGVSTNTCFGKGDHVADRLRFAEYGHQSIKPWMDHM